MKFEKLWKTEDWWSVWLGLGLVILAIAALWMGASIKGWAVLPSKITDFSAVGADLAKNIGGYLIIFLILGVVFCISMKLMGHKLKFFIPGFIILFVGALIIFYVAGTKFMNDWNIEAPLLALIVGLIISNAVKIPEWLKTSLRTEYYVKTGIVLLGATLPFTIIVKAGPIALLQATIVSVVTWLVIYLAATRIFKLEPQFGAVLGTGGAVCGVSAAIAVGGAVKAKNEHISITIAVVTVWAIIMIFVLTISLKQLVPDTVSPGVAGAIVGTSEFADAAGFAVVAELGTRFGDTPIQTFTLMKVIGRDIWIGIWCLILAIVSVAFWEKCAEGEDRKVTVGPRIIWERFPKFVLGFLAGSIIVSIVGTMVPANYAGKANWADKIKGKEYKADFSQFQVPPEFADRMTVDTAAKTLTFKGPMSGDELKALTAKTTSPDQAKALSQLKTKSNWFDSVLSPNVIGPIKNLRSWAFVLCFLCIGLSTRFAEMLTFGMRPFWAFTIGVVVNVPLGIFLSSFVFVDYWSKI
ncbi:MAG: putative sulfate exporter family transporter [Deltaproteobacteria bacterium]|nr:putative sulfate exporter family transporter [Deltaproteobacteria bacterium]